MASHFSSIGVAGPPEAVRDAIAHAAVHGLLQTTDTGTRVVEWTDPGSGASLAVCVDDSGRIECVKPYVAPTGRPARAVVQSLVEDPGCPHCSVLLVEVLYAGTDETAYPLAVEVPDLPLVLPSLVPGSPVDLRISGIVERIDLFADEAAYRASGTPFAMRSLVPSGLFTPGLAPEADVRPPRAEALLSGVVLTAALRRNGRSGGSFWHLLVDTLEAQIDLAVDPALLVTDPEPGWICSVTAWLVARPVPAPRDGGTGGT